MPYFVYIITNYTRDVFYTGVTNNIESRMWEHKTGQGNFSSRYKCNHLMHYEEFEYARDAIAREKQLKKWKWEWKRELIRRNNPDMTDLAREWFKRLK